MKTKLTSVILAPALLALLSTLNLQLSTCSAQGTAFTYQGRLNASGAPANGSYDLAFSLFATNTSGIAMAGPVTNSAIAVSNGLFTTTIDFGPDVFTGSSNWLELAVSTNGANNFTSLTPRQQITPAPYAIMADSANGLPGLTIQQNADANPNVVGGASVNFVADGVEGATIAGGGAAHFIFGQPASNSVLAAWGTVGGGLLNTVGSQFAAVAGGFDNTASGGANGGATVSGGSGNQATNDYATVPGGYDNVAGGQYSFAAGDQAQATNEGAFVWADSQGAPFASTNNNSFNVRAQGGARFVTGGAGLTLDGVPVLTSDSLIPATQLSGSIPASQVSGSIPATQLSGTIPSANLPNGLGGTGNSVTGTATTVAGGQNNHAYNEGATVGGGEDNIATNLRATVSGGIGNTASGDTATVAGGFADIASGSHATVGGGDSNQATNTDATVPGGKNNIAGGQSSFAAGQQAQALHQGTFVWADSQNAAFSSTSSNQFLIRAQGGVGIGINAPLAGSLSVNTNIFLFDHALYLRGVTGVDMNHGLAYNGQTTTNFGTGQYQIDGPALWGYSGGLLGTRNGGDYAELTWNSTSVNIGFTNDTMTSPPALSVVGNRFQGDPLAYIHNIYPPNLLQAGPALRVVNEGDSPDGALSVSVNVPATTSGSYIAEFGNSSSYVVQIGVDGTVYSKGLALTSDRNAKEDFAPVSAQAVLAKVAALPITEWNYKTDAAGQKHLGPMAQDFHAAFGLNGRDDKHISVVDEGGVALAAIQGLNEKVEDQKSALQQKQTEITELKQQLNQLAKTVNELNQKLNGGAQ